jgi:hypothetical protein
MLSVFFYFKCYNHDMKLQKIHAVQSIVLQSLLNATRARYSELRRAAGVESDIFKFHIKKLQLQRYVVKAEDGLYELTAEGKEYASNLDIRGREIAQPRSSMLMIVRCGERIIGHRRDREPYNQFWGIASAPLLRGVPATVSAHREFEKQVGISADFHVHGVFRVIDKDERGKILEDKLFSVMVADVKKMAEPHSWYGGFSKWMTPEELLAKNRLFPTTRSTLEMIERGETFREEICTYRDDEY